jgi:hypothetical protein
MATTHALPPMRVCPNCGGAEIFRVRRHGIVDWFLGFFGMRPFWCDECDGKFHKRLKPHASTEPTS